jgi:hypothetical protein
MTMEPELEPHERARLASWASCDVPDDFAERVMRRAVESSDTRAQVQARVDRRRELAVWRVGVVAAAAAIVLGLVFVAPDRSAAGPDDPATMRAEAQQTLMRHCTPCHGSTREGAEPEAVSVFDVDRDDWDAAISSESLELATVKLASRTTGRELAGFQSYVDGELARRRGLR